MSIELYEYLTDNLQEPNIANKLITKIKKPIIKSFLKTIDLYNGATSQIRTGDPRITSAMLWPAELKWQNIKLVTPTGIEPMSPP